MENDMIMTTSMETPLLASEDGDDLFAPPSLSSGPASMLAEADGGDTEFSRLIAQRSILNSSALNPFQALANRFEHFGGSSSSPSAGTGTAAAAANGNMIQRGPCVIITASTLSLLHMGFIWGSYMSDVWSETHVTIAVSLQKFLSKAENLNSLHDLMTDSVVRSMSLPSLIEDLNSSKNYVLMAIVWAVSLLLPCAFMILSPSWILTDHKFPIDMEKRILRRSNARNMLEVSMRFAFAIMYVFVIIDLASSFVEFHWTNSTVHVRNRALGGLACYVVGIASAVGTIMVLRSRPPSSPTARPVVSTLESRGTSVDVAAPVATRLPSLRSPPPQAFRFPWGPRMDSSSDVNEDEEEEVSMSVLEEPPVVPSTARNEVIPPSGISTPDTVGVDADGIRRSSSQRRVSFCHKALVFQLGLLAVALWIPSLHLPLVRFEYSGLAKDVMTMSSRTIFLWQIPGIIWTQGVEAQTTYGIVGVFSSVIALSLFIIPLLATFLGILVWIADEEWAVKSRFWLYGIQPGMGGIVLVVTLLSTLQAVQSLSTFSMDGSSLCEKFAKLVGDDCLVLSGHLMPGAWFYVVHSLLLEIFVSLTLRWSLM